MEPAKSIITALGGPEKAARLIGVHRTRVFSWLRAKSCNGTGGLIPQRHFARILDIARGEGLSISAADLVACGADRESA